MDDAARMLIRLPWTLAVSGMAGRWLPRDSGAEEGWQTLLRQTENQVGRVMNHVMGLGDQVRKGGMFASLQVAMAAAESLLAGESDRQVWQELHNRMDAFGAFAYVESILKLRHDADMGLPDLVRKAALLDAYTSVWATEGAGHYYMKRHLQQGRLLRNVLREEGTNALPGWSFIPLHAGMGLSIAEHALAPVSSDTSRADLRQALRGFVEGCGANARDGYTGVCLEALGLVARTLRPELIPLIDHTLAEDDTRLLSFFWHGVGRGLYFLPMQFMPYTGSAGRMVDVIRQEAPHRLALYNLMAGFAWPVTLVNIRHPQIIEGYLRDGFSRNPEQEAFSQGMRAAILTWVDSSPDDTSVRALLNHRTDASDAATSGFWATQIADRGMKAIEQVYPALKKKGSFDMLFRYQSGQSW